MRVARVALITNFVAPYRTPLFRRLAEGLTELRVLVSTSMEPNRAWAPDWEGVAVEVLPSLTLALPARHPHGFTQRLFVHLPWSAPRVLARYRPDVVVSGQLGLASVLAALHCRRRPASRLVLWLTLSEVSESGRGWLRRRLRRWLLARADAVMVNGESGARYVRGFGVPESRIFRVGQAVDLKAFEAPLTRRGAAAHRLLFVGLPEPGKGLVPFLRVLADRARLEPERRLELWIAGAEEEQCPLPDLHPPPNLCLRWLGAVPYARMPELYRRVGILAFPTLSDEWGLVVNEAFAAGVPVLGSVHSQAVEELVEEGRTGWRFRPEDPADCAAALDRALALPADALDELRPACRERVEAFSFARVAARMLRAIRPRTPAG
jgi:glycosyltransferase involved in cell wall biosynthesis